MAMMGRGSDSVHAGARVSSNCGAGVVVENEEGDDADDDDVDGSGWALSILVVLSVFHFVVSIFCVLVCSSSFSVSGVVVWLFLGRYVMIDD
ncbi:hypothetical protein SUGI_0449830 [Cryptomeria japonica]|nr:hypothetical protein SUGI_0449830 [Cryptomeria japonica]